ncbi:MAG TPA: phosphodiester glycosidase family protein [Phycisphaerae bacterium]|jgi:hypothetical protein|nr:hypothetical protein [Phycisphaerae bacterium]HOB75143.1 phosphodiester glycosidase family protein [Phycisphaerae bacterium]HOJ54635.1 phosphodiester glycosidase family protein [Phycisphaerae bacterium]HOL27261.1 phosphodiester glycosidase family protein [Phycisphaerae bacterium]HPP21061.1 phosphodiester glycosidase family protein [Phycisphaerae bacterium]
MRCKAVFVAAIGVLALSTCALGQWTEVAAGIGYRQMDLPGPLKVFVVRGDRSQDTWIIDTMTSRGTIRGGRETVPDMVQRYDDSITWDGRRYEIKAAINGEYFNPRTGYSFSGQVMAGWYAKRFTDDGGMSGFFWTTDRRCAIGGDVRNGPKFQRVIFANGAHMNINAFNDQRGKDELALYTSHWDATTGTSDDGVEVLVRMDEPIAVNPPLPGNRGVILKVVQGKGAMPIPFDCVVLSATGTAVPRLLEHARTGSEVHFDMRLQDVGVEGIGLKPAEWRDVWSSLASVQNLLIDGTVSRHWEAKAARLAAEGKPHGSVVKAPRTAIAFNEKSVFFVVIDGRSKESVGMTFTETAEFCKNELQADYAVMQDGGGSSTLWLEGKVRNVPSDLSRDKKRNVLRPVANGYLLARVHPAEFSKVFRAGSNVVAKADIELKLGPGDQYGPAGKMTTGASGQVIQHRLAGVRARGTHWWLIKVQDVEGWAPERSLAVK